LTEKASLKVEPTAFRSAAGKLPRSNMVRLKQIKAFLWVLHQFGVHARL
jgi:hypothetical protein